jgi:hypothetical protein
MAIGGDSSIYRFTTPGNTESNITDKIDFNGGIVPDSMSYINGSAFTLRRALGKQARIKTTRSHKIKDTGFEGLKPVITGFIRQPENQLAEYRAKTWMIEDQDNDDFPFGRFGLRLNDNPAFNTTPTSLKGYYIEEITFRRPAQFKGKLEFSATLHWDGNVGSPNGSGHYLW